ncbi:1,4-dihydroxy-2-naphthoate octaprenyltransferase [Gracilibacillus halophilus YIM-C55.5]|uniref:1,4-dihydroxy-2-naphthoate octaprenyltransferase n=1 Tax=Gracilibacillus halophilus YIM-C55.5 TaxID=1308866 RepID=N4WVL9_9BACI|nr:1,4-dihydroxy-2-naphthoate polyprenyltransferase [Gracilibacillus halophilus]ENH97116.1 1,4-dihydroxy-2-naphthoate octaprenyltransferase [Gracilibacillus halophilus YIM-C55.5]
MTYTKVNAENRVKEKPGFQVWWRLLRPHTLTASFVPVFIGTMLALLDGKFHFLLFITMLLASIIIQAATNMFNEYYDYKRGLDNEESVGIGGTIVRDGVSPQLVKKLAFGFFGLAMLLGIYICIESSWWICLVGLICMLCGYLYTAGPYPIAYSPLGEVVSGLLMGTAIIGISYYIQTLSINWDVILISIPVAIFIGCILLSNSIRDLEEDQENGRKTLAILLGRDKAIYLLAGLMISAYLLSAIFMMIGLLPIYSLISLFAIKKTKQAIILFKANTTNIGMAPAMGATAKTNTMYGMLIGMSLLIHYFFPLSL